MRLTFCGTAAGVAINPDRAFSGIHLTHEDASLLVDCGPGSIREMVRQGLDHTSIEEVVFSHLHADHAMDIAGLLLEKVTRSGSAPVIYGPQGTAEYLEAAVAFTKVQLPPNDSKRRDLLDGTQVEITRPGDEREIAGLAVRSVEVPHAAHLECLARRFEAGDRTLVYSGDTTVAPEIMTPLSEGADVLIHEAYSERALQAFLATKREAIRDQIAEAFAATHTVLPEAAKIAQAAGVGRLVVTHLLAEEDEASMVAEAGEFFGGEVLVAREGMAIEV